MPRRHRAQARVESLRLVAAAPRRSPDCPSEFVVATALRHHLPDFLAAGPPDTNWRKFLRSRLDLDQVLDARLAA